MKKKLYRCFAIIMVSVLGLGFTGCGDDITEEHYYEGAFVLRNFFEIAPEDWTWYDDTRQFECYRKMDGLTKDIYNDGAMTASVFIDTGTKDEVQQILPFVHTYDFEVSPGTWKPYTETIRCAFEPGGVRFSIQASDLESDPSVLFPYEFKVSIFWD